MLFYIKQPLFFCQLGKSARTAMEIEFLMKSYLKNNHVYFKRVV